MLDEAHSDRLLLENALNGFGNDKTALIEFLCARTPRRVLKSRARASRGAEKELWEKERREPTVPSRLSE